MTKVVKVSQKRKDVNFARTNVDGWRGQIRAYRPDVEKMRLYQMPELKELTLN